jgi:hypothetical protein
MPLVVPDQPGQFGITCPTCFCVTLVPAGGVAGLQSASGLLETQGSTQELEESLAATTDSNLVENVRRCSVHEGRDLELYCETCEEHICTRCALRGGRHHSHQYDELSQAFEKYKQQIAPLLEPLENQVVTITQALSQLDLRCEAISDQETVTEDSIRTTFARLQETLRAREVELIDRLHQITQIKLKDLAAQRDQLDIILAQLNSCIHCTQECLSSAENERDVPMLKVNVIKQARKLLTPFQPGFLEPNTEADMKFSASSDVISICGNHGLVYAPGLPDPSKCLVTGKDGFLAMAGEMSTAILQAFNFDSKHCERPIESFQCQFVSEITDIGAKCRLEGRGQGQYKISYQPTIKGRHQLHIIAEGQHIKGSPFNVTVKSPLDKLGTPIPWVG